MVVKVTEYESEPVRGLPDSLPEGEQLLWQGAPEWRSMARHVFHVRKVLLYFAVLIVGHGAIGAWHGESAGSLMVTALWQGGLVLFAVAVLTGLAWLYARSSVYTLTSERLVLRFGVALPMMVNLPLERISEAALRPHSEGTGDIRLTMVDGHRVSYWALWPHVRPLYLRRPQPMLRCVPSAKACAEQLAKAVAGEPGVARGVRTHQEPRSDDAAGAMTPVGAAV